MMTEHLQSSHIVCGKTGYITLVDPDIAEDLGRFSWSARKNKRASTPYVIRCVCLFGKVHQFQLHRVIMDALPNQMVDHINGNGLDNRRCNLRLATVLQNNVNRRSRPGSTSKYVGVHWCSDRGKWMAAIGSDNGRKKNLGRYLDEVEAAKAYDKAAFAMYGEFANLNFPEGAGQ
jgi:hypothetical protein